VTWSLAAGVFPSIHPNWNTGLIIGLSLVASFLFFASVLVHAFAHSLVARARGMPVRRITLFIFGGVSNIEKEPASAVSEFWMALVGP
jgi:Zn-dependent protease